MTKFATNPFMFKINAINGQELETVSSAANVLGQACHKAMRRYLGGDPDAPTSSDRGEAIKEGHATGLEYLKNYSGGFIKYNEKIPNRAALDEKFAFCYFRYIEEFDLVDQVAEILIVERYIKHKVEIDGKILPIALVCYPDLVFRDKEGRIRIWDHKITGQYSKQDELDAPKMLQAAITYFLIYAELNEAPYSMTFREFKYIENRDKSPQTKPYTIIYEELPMVFELFYRMYEDVTNALLGKQVYVPNFNAIYDKEVAILAYIHRLDVDEERAQKFKEMKVDNITDFLKKKIQKEGAMKKYLETVNAQFISATTLNYKDMTTQEKIKMKLAQHGLGVEFQDQIKGHTVTLFRFEPAIGLKMTKIEAYVKDIEQVVEVSDIRVIAPMRDSGLVGFEVPNADRTFPSLPGFEGFNIAIGTTIMGKDRRYDIRDAPHILVAGETGSGKSVWLNNAIKQLIATPRVEMYLFDPKQVELDQFEGMPRVREYAFDPEEIEKSLESIVEKMEERYTRMKEAHVRNIKDMPAMKYKFIVIDEFADLNMRGNVGHLVQKIAQKGRAAGIHLIIATQRASSRVISGDIKVNFPVKVIFKMPKVTDSMVMLDQRGAETLKGKGDMLFLADKGLERLQGYHE